MKNLKIILFAALMAGSTSAFAQFANTGATGAGADTEDYDRIQVSYAPTFYNYDYEDADNQTFNGFAVGYIHGFSVSKAHPLFIETGANLNLGFHSEDYDEDISLKYTTLSVNVPVNLAYKYTFSNGRTSIAPYTGFHFKFNALANVKAEYEDESESESMFDKDIWDDDAVWKRFQFGWHIGVGLNLSKAYIGLEYGLDFNELAKKLKTSQFTLSVGLNF